MYTFGPMDITADINMRPLTIYGIIINTCILMRINLKQSNRKFMNINKINMGCQCLGPCGICGGRASIWVLWLKKEMDFVASDLPNKNM